MNNNSSLDKFQIMMVMFLFIYLTFLFSPSLSATQTFKQSQLIDLKVQCIINGTFCSSNGLCNLTISYPNASLLINNQKMTNQISFYNYTLPTLTSFGVYSCSATCCDNNLCGTDNSCTFNINGIGSDLSPAQSILYFIILGGLLIFLIFTIWGAIIFPWKNQRNELDQVVSINDLKYLKVILWILVYLEVLFISLILSNLSSGYLASEGSYSFFNIVYNLLLIGMLPMFPLIIAFTIIIWLNDKKTQKNIARGIPVR